MEAELELRNLLRFAKSLLKCSPRHRRTSLKVKRVFLKCPFCLLTALFTHRTTYDYANPSLRLGGDIKKTCGSVLNVAAKIDA